MRNKREHLDTAISNIMEQLRTIGKFDKKENCQYCEEKMVAKYRNKRFCSQKCRVYWNRENKKISLVTPTITTPKIENKSLRDKLNSL